MRSVTFGDGDGLDDETWKAVRRTHPPDYEVPVTVPLSVVLHRGEDVALAVTGAYVYTTGVAFNVMVRIRPGATGFDGLALHEVVGGGPPRRRSRSGLLLGIELANGRTLSTLDPPVSPFDTSLARDHPVLKVSGSGGGESSFDVTYWLAPLPSPGRLTFVVMCEALGVSETSVVVDADPLVAAGAQATRLWDPQPPQNRQRTEPPPPPDLPAGSWFANRPGPHRQD